MILNVQFTEELVQKLRGFNAKAPYPLNNRVQLNLSKEEVDYLVWLIENCLTEARK